MAVIINSETTDTVRCYGLSCFLPQTTHKPKGRPFSSPRILPILSGGAYSRTSVERIGSQIHRKVTPWENPFTNHKKKKIMDSATPFDVSGGSGEPRSKLQTTLSLFCKQWPYICKFHSYTVSFPSLCWTHVLSTYKKVLPSYFRS